MGARLGKSKSEEKKGFFGYELCPGSSKKQKNNISNCEEVKVGKNEKSPQPKNNSSGWSDIDLEVPDSILEIENQIIREPPVPPPRKNRSKTNTIEKLESRLLTSSNAVDRANTTDDYSNLIPVEEPIIVPKKEPVHICDGTHHHVTNIVNGKVIHSHCTISKYVAKSEQEKPPPPVRPKFTSTVSLPDIDELKSATQKKATKKKESNKGTQRQISVISLPTDSKITLSDATAARVENYLRRCKNSRGITSKQLLEELQLNGHNSDSDDSWDGLNDWGINVLEYHEMPVKSPFEPRFRLDNRPAARSQVNPKILIEEEDTRDEPYLNYIAERRESIDDFFDSKVEPVYPSTIDEEDAKQNTELGRRGSDSFFNVDKEFYMGHANESGSKLKSDIFYTNAFLESESRHFDGPLMSKKKEQPSKVEAVSEEDKKEQRKPKKHIETPANPSKDLSVNNIKEQQPKLDLHLEKPSKSSGIVLGDDTDLLETFQEFYNAHDKLSTKKIKEEENGSLTVALETDLMKPKRKVGNVQHSNLLKIIQDNALAVEEEKNQETKTSKLDTTTTATAANGQTQLKSSATE